MNDLLDLIIGLLLEEDSRTAIWDWVSNPTNLIGIGMGLSVAYYFYHCRDRGGED